MKSSEFHRIIQQSGWTEVRQAGWGFKPPSLKTYIIMEKIKVIIDRATDGTYDVYCENHPMLFGAGRTIEEAKEEMLETMRITKEEIGREQAACYPDWLDTEHEFKYKFDVQGLLEYYAGIITPTALGKLAGINPKQMWNYMHGLSKPRRAQIEKIEAALHKLGDELINISF